MKEEIKILNAANQIMAEKISQREDDCASDMDEEETHTRGISDHKEFNISETHNNFEDFDEMFQTESV